MTEIVRNKKAYFDYDIVSHYEAGIELKGHEVKSIRAGNVNLKGSYISLLSGVLLVKSMHISPYHVLSNRDSIDPIRDRKVFLHKKDILQLAQKSQISGYTIVPLRLYYVGNLIKLEVGLVRGRQKHQKKQVLKERTMQREAQKSMKHYI